MIPSVVEARIVNKGGCANSPFPHLIMMVTMMGMMMVMVLVMVINTHIALVAT